MEVRFIDYRILILNIDFKIDTHILLDVKIEQKLICTLFFTFTIKHTNYCANDNNLNIHKNI